MLSNKPVNSPRKNYKTPFSAELRSQLNEQLRALDLRVDTQSALVAELQDWFRKRAELHQDYSTKLDKLTKSLQARHKEQKVKREQWSLFSVYNCWQVLVNQTKRDARDHAAMADVYVNNIIPRFTEVHEDLQRIYKKCRDIGYESHEELLKVLHELHTTMRTYHTYQAEYKSAEVKLQNFEAQKLKLEQVIPKEKLEKSKKFRVIEKEIQKRNNKFIDSKLKALKARNEYILSMESANTAIHKYFVEDLSDVVDCMDFGFHNSIARALLAHISGQDCFKRTLQTGIDDLSKSKSNLDSRFDKQRFLEYNNTAFMLPKKFEFQSHKGDEMSQVLVTRQIQEEMEKRYAHLSSRLTNLKTESEETWKTIETAEKTLIDMTNTRDYDIAHYFAEEPRPENKIPEVLDLKRKSDRHETEEFYLSKFREYTLGSNLIYRLQARFDLMRKGLGAESPLTSSPTQARNQVNKPRRRRIGRTPLMGQPRLFGGSLEEYLEATSIEIPVIMKSCIRVINLYGLHHQGIFRVSGSQLEINNFRESFEKMEDPLADVTDASDINSVAGVFKLFLRELREPIFPTVYFEQFMEIAQLESKQDFVTKVREVVISLPRPVFVVMRYLFAFLNHLSEFSDENMMDPYNLAICFGPTLVPIPEDKDQVQYQNLVNELIKNIIIFSEDIFPNDGGPVYEKYISDLETDIDFAPVDVPDEAESDEPSQSEDDSVFRDPIADQLFGKSEILEAIAQFDFTARSDRELSFNKGEILVLHSQVSSDWWKGSIRGKLGLIPDKYILLKIRDEDKDRQSEKSGMEEILRRRASSSSESILTSSSHLSDSQHSRRNTAGSPGPTGGITRTSLQDRSLSPATHDRHSLGDTTSSSPVPSLNSLCSSTGGGDGSGLTSDSSPHTPPGSICSLSSLPQVPEENGLLHNGDKSSCNRDVMSVSVISHCTIKKEYLNESTSSMEIPIMPIGGTKEMSHSPKPRLTSANRMFTSFSDPPGTDSPSGGSAGVISQSMVEVRESVAEAIELWNQHSRPSSQSSLSSSSSDDTCQAQWDHRTRLQGVSGTPDLVMDLPVGSLSSSPKEQSTSVSPKLLSSRSCETHERPASAPSGTQSPDISAMTAAECFAKQSQSTLKKTPTVVKAFSSSSTDAQTQTILTPVVTDASQQPESKVTSDDLEGKSSEDGASSLREPGDASPLSIPHIKEADPRRLQIKDVHIELRSASDLPSPSADPPLMPSTPKLAARYLKAVALSGGGTGVAVKPQVRIKPTVLKKPSLPRSATSPEPESSKGTN